jgi:hypothetical protein
MSLITQTIDKFNTIFKDDDIWISETFLKKNSPPLYSFVISGEKMTTEILKKMNHYFEEFQNIDCFYYVDISKLIGIDTKILGMQSDMIGKMNKNNKVRMVIFHTKTLVKPLLSIGLKGMSIPVKTKIFTKGPKVFEYILNQS